MKTKKIFYALLILAVVCTFSSCKKYPDGPLISLRSRMKRVEGTWKITGFYINGNNAIDSVSFISEIDFIKATEHNGLGSNRFVINCKAGGWVSSFSFKRGNLYLGSPPILLSPHLPSLLQKIMQPQSGSYIIFKIMKLRNKSMILERTVSENTYRIELKNIRK